MKKILTVALCAVVLASTLLLSGCFTDLFYGTWQIAYTADEFSQDRQDYSPLYSVYVNIKSDGSVDLIIGGQTSSFGTYTRKGNTYTFTYANPTSTGVSSFSGSWTLSEADDGTELCLYRDDIAESYVLYRVNLE